MVLSSEREAELIEQNMQKIYRSIDNFMSRYKGQNYLSYEDCVQEVSIAFLLYIRRCQSEDQLRKFPWYDAIHSLSEYVLRNQQFSIPSQNNTKRFTAILRSLPSTVSFDVLASGGIDVDGMSKQWVPDTDTKIDFDAFMSEQQENIQRIASMRIFGMTQRDIAAQCGVSKTFVVNKINKLREKYDEFTKEDEDDE